MTLIAANPEVSAVICTHNRAAFLEETLNALLHQEHDAIPFEVVVVDNCSTDNTREICDRAISAGLPLRYFMETRLGVCYARNLGWQNAAADFVFYLDDDAIPEPSWLASIVRSITTLDSTVGCIGGRVIPRWMGHKPEWADDRNEISLGYVDFGDERQILDDSLSPIGANVGYPKRVLEATGGFVESLGRRGDSLLGCEETLLERMIRKQGLQIVYDPSVVVRHAIHADRLTPDWILRRTYWQGASLAICDMILNPVSSLERVKQTALRGLQLLIPPVRTLIRALRGTGSLDLWRKSYYFRLGYFSGLTGLHRMFIHKRRAAPAQKSE